MQSTFTAERIWSVHQRVGELAPLVQNLSNLVVQYDTAQAIAAVGGTQLTLLAREEAEAVAGIAQALVLNSGTLDSHWLEAAQRALDVAVARGTPWLLDPVAAGLTPFRDEQLRGLLQRGPQVIKGNASEILTLAGQARGGHGADSRHSVSQAMLAARSLARARNCVVVVSGPRDYLCDAERAVELANGQPLLGRMIGSGCMLGAVLGGYLAVEPDSLLACTAGVACFTVAGELACERASGPGSLKPQFFDALFQLRADDLAQRLKVLQPESA
ncbi:hydroxyethylthiazole kinase [Alkalilimnicola sp. S0819]|uniref:hydroxyethylthiazole kinase n=1 Tax=Alkalilimnicola sp. S0819 TaxID=2613922 RepID=UPI001262903A|nr:hydroxyethylthiazole kinase [Alkalilimnicola sp. S0819]KAB7623914.1 hydroxyethylthiazole kinase [Alkalilimnicola sp. S0819]MPQ16510.1 hydroxyethylthiazole kinase [Alkalilimnicola sp. S0819]